LKFCPFDWSTMMRFGCSAAVAGENKRTPMIARYLSSEFGFLGNSTSGAANGPSQ
jgi:hypothetical protein